MAIPKIFVSSTCYDLKYIRENLKLFINEVGYESILSEYGDVYYDVSQHTHDACISEIQNCQIFVLIIGGRHGGNFMESEKSITNMEYEEAKLHKVPIFTLVERNVYSDHHLYTNNKNNEEIDATKIHYPNIDNIKIFDFIDEVRKSSVNNAIFTFSNFFDIQSYLKKQWAGMMFQFLTSTAESKRVSQLLEQIRIATDKIEFYTKQSIEDSGIDRTKHMIAMYDIILKSPIVKSLLIWGISITPTKILLNETLDDLCDNKLDIEDKEGSVIYGGGPPYRGSETALEKLRSEYATLYSKLLQYSKEHNVTLYDN